MPSEGIDDILSLDNTSGKGKAAFRVYNDESNSLTSIVRNHYKLMRKYQTVSFVKKMHEKYSFKDGNYRRIMTINEAFKILENYVDSSDPDVSLPNKIHMLQTAESIRRAGQPDWFQLIGLIHDMGKIMYALGGVAEDGQEGTATGPQWALGGDTWVVGCKIPDACVYPEFNETNLDNNIEEYNTENGIYSPNCGIDNLLFAYGHDEYIYHMVLANNTLIPKEGLAMLRYHSAYPWHTGRAYDRFMIEEDHEKLKWVLEFNKYDLYTKDQNGLNGKDAEELWPYYQGLIEKYFPDEAAGLKW